MKCLLDDGNQAAQYSEIAATIQKLKDHGRKYEESERFLQRILQYSELAAKRESLIDANAVFVVAGHLRNGEYPPIQRYAAGILLNLGQSGRGRLAICSCSSWECLSYRHECPLFYLLHLAQTSRDLQVKQVSSAAVMNVSFHATCQAHFEDIGGIQLLLKLLTFNDEDVSVYIAAASWNLCKSSTFVLKLETIHSKPIDTFQRMLSQILWTRCSNYGLTITTNTSMASDQSGVLESCGDNLNLVFACSINSKLAVAMRIEQYNVVASQTQADSRVSYKSTQKFDENGKQTAVTCAVCGKSIKEKTGKTLVCCNEGCYESYHIRCSRWSKVDPALIAQNRFFCDGCLPKMPLQHLDFIAVEKDQSKVLAKLDFDILDVQRLESTPTCMLRSTTGAILGIGAWKYTCRAKGNSAIIQIKYFLRHTSSMCYTQASNGANNSAKPKMPFDFPFLKGTTVIPTLELHALALWPSTHVIPIQDSLYLTKSPAEIEQAYLYEFDGNDERFAIGSIDGGEIWCSLQPSRAKCMKMMTEALAKGRGTKKKVEKKPHFERKLEK